jgi:predicted nucleic acid-binding protein
MTPFIIDASVAIKWFLPETHSINAMRLLTASREMLAPDLLFSECGNVLWKKWLRQEIMPEVIPAILHDLSRMRMRIVPTVVLIEEASRIAVTYRRSFYDSVYLALAAANKGHMVTGDEKLVNALRGTSLESVVLAIAEINTVIGSPA